MGFFGCQPAKYRTSGIVCQGGHLPLIFLCLDVREKHEIRGYLRLTTDYQGELVELESPPGT